MGVIPNRNNQCCLLLVFHKNGWAWVLKTRWYLTDCVNSHCLKQCEYVFNLTKQNWISFKTQRCSSRSTHLQYRLQNEDDFVFSWHQLLICLYWLSVNQLVMLMKVLYHWGYWAPFHQIGGNTKQMNAFTKQLIFSYFCFVRFTEYGRSYVGYNNRADGVK